MDLRNPFPIDPQNPDQILERVVAMRAEAVTLANSNRHEEALQILVEAERICRDSGQEKALAYILHEKAITLSTGGDPGAAIQVVEEAEEICYALADWRQLYHILRSKWVFYGNLDDDERSRQALDEADEVLTEWLQQARQGDDPADLVDVLLLYAMRPRAMIDGTDKNKLFDEALDVATHHQLSDKIGEIERLKALFRGAGIPIGRSQRSQAMSVNWGVVITIIFILLILLRLLVELLS